MSHAFSEKQRYASLPRNTLIPLKPLVPCFTKFDLIISGFNIDYIKRSLQDKIYAKFKPKVLFNFIIPQLDSVAK